MGPQVPSTSPSAPLPPSHSTPADPPSFSSPFYASSSSPPPSPSPSFNLETSETPALPPLPLPSPLPFHPSERMSSDPTATTSTLMPVATTAITANIDDYVPASNSERDGEFHMQAIPD